MRFSSENNMSQGGIKLSLILLFLQLWGNVEVSLSQNACSQFPDVPHAHVSEETKKSQYQEGDVIHFLCDPGYISDQTSKYACTGDGWLVVHRGTCYSCAMLPDVPHAHVTEQTRKAEYQVGHVIDFTCEPGYTSGLTIKYVCSSEGWLVVRRGSCHHEACKLSAMPPNLYVAGLPPANETVKIGHKLRFQCSDEHVLDGSKETECLETGLWSAPFPTCSGKCKVPEVPSNITTPVAGNHLLRGQTLTFGCRLPGHFVQGNATIECLENGQWSGPIPTCGVPLGCDRPPYLPDGDTKGTFQYRYMHNDRAEYACQRYYTMEGGPYKTCNNGEWTGEIRCIKPCTVDREAMTRHNIQFRFTRDNKLYSVHNDEIEFVCTRGRPVSGVRMRQMCIDGVVDLPTCQ